MGLIHPDRRLCVAPMMSHTNRHFRYLLRLISSRVMLYTEMITAEALLRGSTAGRLLFDPAEHPLGIQLGGSDPGRLAACARLAEEAGYDEVNLNVGCPSDRVHTGRFGACLFAEPGLVADCVAAMRTAVSIPVTVKTRTGIDDLDDYLHLSSFVSKVAAAGCNTFMIHARKAWLQGLTPRQNRTVPPLRHELVYRLKRDRPDLEIILNGGVCSLEEVARHLEQVDGVMIGRAACNHPYLLAGADDAIYGLDRRAPSRREVLGRFMDYAEQRLSEGENLYRMTRHVLGLFRGESGARAYRRILSEKSVRTGAGVEVMEEALNIVIN